MVENDQTETFNQGEVARAREIVVPKEELAALADIKEYWEKMIEDDNHKIKWPENPRDDIKKVFDSKMTAISGSDQRKNVDLVMMREAEYEVFKDEIEYRKELLKKLMDYMENKQGLWETKFSTSQSLILDKWTERKFSGDGSETRERDETSSFAGLSRDSIYYVTKSGVSVRLKADKLFDPASLQDYPLVLQPPREQLLFVYSRESGKAEEVYDTANGKFSVNESMASLSPTLEYRVIECTSSGMMDDTSKDFVSKIRVGRANGRLEVSGISTKKETDFHQGHQVNRIWKM